MSLEYILESSLCLYRNEINSEHIDIQIGFKLTSYAGLKVCFDGESKIDAFRTSTFFTVKKIPHSS